MPFIPQASLGVRWHVLIEVDNFMSRFKRLEVRRILRSESYVEIQYLNNGDYNLILFIDEPTASEIAQLNGESEHKLMAALYPWGEMHSLVSLPVRRIIKSKAREVQVSKERTETVLDLMIR
jgi:hypothetical protein